MALQDNREYLSDAEAVDKMLCEHFPVKLTREEIDRMLEESEGEELG